MMNNNGFITKKQMARFIVGICMGTEVLFLPNNLVRYGRQDSYIFEAVGVIYPLFIVLIARYMCKNHPSDNILTLSKKYIGNFIGSILNFLLLIEFLFYTTIRCSQLSNIIRVYIVYFLTPQIIFSTVTLIAAFCTYKGIKSIVRVNEVVFLTYLMILVPAGAIGYGDFHNLLPVFKLDSPNYTQAIMTSFNSYFGIEILLLFYPFMENKEDIIKAGIKGTFIVAVFCIWFTAITIYYLGIDVIPKYLWAFVQTTKALKLVTIKNFVFIFMFFWSAIIIKSIVDTYYVSAFILNNLISKIKIKIYSILLIPVIFFISFIYKNETTCRNIYNSITPLITIFNVIYISVIALLIYIKKGKKSENS